MKKLAYVVVFIMIALPLSVFAVNYFVLQSPIEGLIAADGRDAGISISVHYEDYILPNSLVYDIRDVPLDKAPMDVTRVLLQYAAAVKDKSFDSILLEYRGRPKFRLKGDYFHTLGIEYGSQNPVYTLRTLPENVLTPAGLPAFGTWTGGWIGVLAKQMEDLSEFHKQWFISDMTNEPAQ
jgi:hypothetical protein